MIITGRLTLRQWKEPDLTALQKLRNDADLQALLLSTAQGSSLPEVRNWLINKSNGEGQRFFVIERVQSQEVIGYIQLSAEAGATAAYRFGICLAPDFWSQGFGTELLNAIEQYMRVNTGACKMLLNVDNTNARAIGCYRKLDYREVGVMQRHVLVQGQLRDVLVMEKWIGPSQEHCD